MKKITKTDKKYLAYFFDELFDVDIDKEVLLDLDYEKAKEIKKLIEKRYKAKFGLVGCTGVGKTTTIRSLFGFKQKKNKTEKLKKYKKNLGKGVGEVMFYDFPGLGDWEKKREFIEGQYDKHLPECDVILWVIDASNRVIALDEDYIKKMPSEIREKMIIGLHKVNMVDPYDEWDNILQIPSIKQEKEIVKRKKEISENLEIPLDKIVEYSAYKGKVSDTRYNLEELVKKLVSSTSNNKFILGNAFLRDITQPLGDKGKVKKSKDPITERILDFLTQKKGENEI